MGPLSNWTDRFSSGRHGPASVLALTSLAVLLISCGSGDGTTPTGTDDNGQTVVVTVSTTGVDLDPDGYTVRLGSRSASVSTNGSATFEDVPAGSHELRLDGVASNCLVEGSPVRTISVTVSTGASTSFTVDCGVDFGDGLPTVSCDALSLQASSALPLTRLAAGSVPAGVTAPLAARVLTHDKTMEGIAWFEDDGQGGLEFVTPLHPSGAIDGGPVWIRATDGSAACRPWPFEVEALPAAPGELGRALDALQASHRDLTAVLETTPEALMEMSVEGVPTLLLPLWSVQWVLDHPGNPASLRAVADGTSADAVPLELLEAVLAHIGFVGALTESHGPMASSASGVPVGQVTGDQCTPQAIGNDGPALADCMLAGQAMEGVVQGFADDLAGSLQPVLPHWESLHQHQGIIRAILVGLGWARLQQELEVFATLPTILMPATVTPTPGRFMEDDDRTGRWTLDVEARSWGWSYAKTAAELMISGAIVQALWGVGIREPDLAAQLAGVFGDPVTSFLQEADIPIQDFGPARMEGDEWSDVEYLPASESPLSVEGIDHHTYRPIQAGTTLMQVITPSMEGDDYGRPRRLVQTELIVDSILIRVDPARTFVGPDERNVPFRITVDNALFPEEIEIMVEQGSVTAPQGTSGVYHIAYNPPGSPSFTDPDSIHVEYVGGTGPAATGPPRFGFAIVRFGEITILPTPACLDTDEEQTFTAEVEGIENQEVEWSAAVGNIDAGGNYRAPASAPAGGLDTIRATSVEEPELVGEVVVPIGCTCNFTVTLGSEVVTAQPGDRLSFNTDDGSLWRVSARRPSRSWNITLLPPDSEDWTTWPDTPGAWPMIIQGTMGLTDPNDVIYATPDPDWGTLDLEALVPFQHVQGRARGSATVVSHAVGSYSSNVDWFFAIRGSSCTVGEEP